MEAESLNAASIERQPLLHGAGDNRDYTDTSLHSLDDLPRVTYSGGTWRGWWRQGEAVATAAAFVGGIGCGMSMGYSSPALPSLREEALITTDTEAAWLGSLLTIGALGGAVVSAPSMEKLGRKDSMLICGLLFTFGWLGQAASLNLIMLYLSRIVVGVAAGLSMAALPIYMVEAADSPRRGALGCAPLIGLTLGVLLEFGLGVGLSWRWLALAGQIDGILLVVLTLPIPDTPRWLLVHRDRQAALESMYWLHSDRQVSPEEECDEIWHHHVLSQGQGVTLRELFQRRVWLPLLVAASTTAMMQLMGISATTYYAQDIFEAAEIGEFCEKLGPVIMAATQAIATIPLLMFLEVVGRRPLLIVSSIGMTLAMAAIGLGFYLLKHSTSHVGWMVFAGLCVYCVSFSLGWGSLATMLVGEMLPGRLRGVGCALAIMVLWGSSFLVARFYPPLLLAVGEYCVFWGFSGMCVIGLMFVIFVLPETKGKTLGEIEAHFHN